MAPSRSRSLSRSRSRSRSPYRRRSLSKSRSRSRSCSRKSRSRSHSPIYKRRSSRSRSKSKSRTRSRSRTRSSRSPMSTRKRHVGDREAPPSGKCLGIFGLSLYTTEREVRTLFEKYGKVDECRIVNDRGTGRSRGFGFVNMGNVADAEDAKEQLNGEKLDGRCIRVDFSITKRAHTPTPGKYLGRPDQSMGRSGKFEGGASNTRRGGGGYGSSSRGYRRSRSRSRSRSPYVRDRR